MEIFGNEYGFLLTVGASVEVAELCPGGDLGRIGEVLKGRFSETIETVSRFAVAMAKGYDDAEAFAGHAIEHPPLTVEMMKALPMAKFKEVQAAALESFKASATPTVEVEPSKKKETLSE